MIEVTGYFAAMGPLFSPGQVEAATGVRFTTKNEPGELGARGRYRGKAIPYGRADISGNASGAALVSPDSELLKQALAIIEPCRIAGATSFVLHLDVKYWNQCNLEFSPSFLSAIAALGADVTITCYEGNSESNPGVRDG